MCVCIYNKDEVGFLVFIAASHQGAIEIFWLHFEGGVMFIYTLKKTWDNLEPEKDFQMLLFSLTLFN